MSFITATNLLACVRHPEDTYEILARAATNQMPWTEMRIHREGDQVWAQYHKFPFLMGKIIGDTVADYLEAYRIDLSSPENEGFSVHKLYRDFSNSTNDPVYPVSMSEYFKEIIEKDQKLYLNGKKSIHAFLSAEAAMVKVLLKTLKSDSVFFHPIPLGNDDTLDKVIYLIFDRKVLDHEQKKALDTFPMNI